MDVGVWLRELGLERYEQAFRDNGVDGGLLARLTAEDLREIGVAAVGHRRRLLDAILALRAEIPAPLTPAASPSRRQLTVMFVDLVDSTALSTRLDLEDLREVMGTYHARVAEVVGRFGGFVAKYRGDGVLAYLGYPRAQEDDAEQAIRAGLELVRTVRDLGSPAEPTLRVRVGIATGLVVVGDLIGSGTAQEQAVVGETPNLAARLQALAAPDSVVVASATRRLVGELCEYADLGIVQAKGFTAPVSAYRILGTGAAKSRFEALHAALTPLVGREEEIGLLLRGWRHAAGGEGQVVLLSGEPGIRKSRILAARHEA